MNLRILKKRSKQAIPFLAHYGQKLDEIFLAKKGENYHDLVVRCSHQRSSDDFIQYMDHPLCGCQVHPLKGTPMIGKMCGYEEPEWKERTALDALQDAVVWQGRAPSMTDDEWDRVLHITRVKPITDEELRAMAET